jgi:hypothetical protein
MTRGPDWLRADPGASTLAEIDMTAKRGMERPPARSTSARGRDSSVPRRGARTPRCHRPNLFILHPWTSILPIQGNEFLQYLCSLV